MSQATELPELARSYEYAEYYNMAIGKETYTPEMIQKYRDGSDRTIMPTKCIWKIYWVVTHCKPNMN